jgi:hypothetical protein
MQNMGDMYEIWFSLINANNVDIAHMVVAMNRRDADKAYDALTKAFTHVIMLSIQTAEIVSAYDNR